MTIYPLPIILYFIFNKQCALFPVIAIDIKNKEIRISFLFFIFYIKVRKIVEK